MPIWIEHVIVVALVAVPPVRGIVRARRLRQAAGQAGPQRVSVYRMTLLVQWAWAAGVAALWGALGRPWSALGLSARAGVVGWALIGVSALVAAGLVRSVRSFEREGPALMPGSRAAIERQRHLLPHTREELAWFAALAVTVGICEELLYRGYLIWYLAHWFQPALVAAAVACALFGVGHAYQGVRGVVLSALLGGMFAAVYLGTGSLLPAMALHAAFDAAQGVMGYMVLAGEQRR